MVEIGVLLFPHSIPLNISAALQSSRANSFDLELAKK
jgi:hypothetical protein